jgi:hypothetical protein
MAVASVKGATQNLIRTSVPNLISGISQQADSFKLTTQAYEQINAVSSVVDGLIKRPSTYLTKEIAFNIPSSTASYPYGANGVAVYPKLTPLKYFKITTSELTDYIGIVFHNSATNDKSVKIFDLEGTEINVIYAGGSQAGINSYLSGLTTEALGSSIKTLSIADYTFFLNSSKTTAMSGTLSPRATAGIGGTEVYQGIVVVKTGYTGNKRQNPSGTISWSIKVVGTNDIVYAQASGDSDAWNSDNDPNVNSPTGGVPTTIANDIATKLNAGIVGGFGTYGRIAVSGSNVYIQNSQVDFKIIVDDGYAGTLFYSVKDNVQNFTDLPVIAPHGFLAKITGLPDSAGDEYYVSHESNYTGEFLGAGSAVSTPVGIFAVNEGPWSETRGAGIEYKIDPATMPHALVKLNNSNFLFTPINGVGATYNLSGGGTASYTAPSWGSRDSGDVDSNPNPSFIGKSITNLFFFKNRLGLLSGEAVILSQAGEFFNFFKSTTAQTLDSDPIDISSSTTEIGTLYHALPFYDRVVLFANGLQFSLQSDGELTSKSVSLQQSTSFNVDINAEPIAIGNKIYFAVNKGDFSSVQEYYINPNTILLDGIDVTANVPSYLNGSVSHFSGSDISSLLLCSSSTKKHELGVYKFFYSGDEKVQSSWSKWSFGVNNNVKLAYIKRDKVYFIIETVGTTETKISMVYLDLDPTKKDAIGTPTIQALVDYKSSDFTLSSTLTNGDGTFSLITLNNRSFVPLTQAEVKITTPYNVYNVPFASTIGFDTTDVSYSSFLSSPDIKFNKFKVGSGLSPSLQVSAPTTDYVLTPIGSFATTPALALSAGQFIEFSITLGKYKSFYLTGFSNFQLQHGNTATSLATLFYSSNNSDFSEIGSQVLSGSSSTIPLTAPLELKGGAEERTYYFRVAFNSSISNIFRFRRQATNPTINGYLIPSYTNASSLNFGTTGLMYNKSPYQFIDSSGVAYDTYYAIYNTSGVAGVPVAGSIGYCSHNKLFVKTNLSNATGVIGIPYPMTYEISRPVLRSASGKGQSAVADGRLQLKNGILLYDNSRFFQVLVTPKYRDTYNYTYLYNFVPNYLGVGPTNLDYMHMEDGAFTFPVFCRSDDVKVSILNEAPYPCALLSLEWEALYSARSKRIG